MWDLVGNPEDRFSHNEADIVLVVTCYNSILLIQEPFEFDHRLHCTKK